MLHDISLGCAYLHERGAIHRDLKCSNVLVDQVRKRLFLQCHFMLDLETIVLPRQARDKHGKKGVETQRRFLVQSFKCKIADFGLSRLIDKKHAKEIAKMSPMEKSQSSVLGGGESFCPSSFDCRSFSCRFCMHLISGTFLRFSFAGERNARGTQRPKLQRQLTRKYNLSAIISPEVMSGQKYDEKVDCFSFGARY
jgi:serine/threonine protein kinase